MRIRLGQKVRNVVNGFEGIASSRTVPATGCDYIAVRPQVKEDGTVPETKWYDELELEIIGADPILSPSDPHPVPDFPFGSRVRESLTGMEGFYVAHCLHINGCTTVAIQSKPVRGKLEEAEWFDIGRIHLVRARNVLQARGSTGGPPSVSMPPRA